MISFAKRKSVLIRCNAIYLVAASIPLIYSNTYIAIEENILFTKKFGLWIYFEYDCLQVFMSTTVKPKLQTVSRVLLIKNDPKACDLEWTRRDSNPVCSGDVPCIIPIFLGFCLHLYEFQSHNSPDSSNLINERI